MPREINVIQSLYNDFFTIGNTTIELRIMRSVIDPAWSLEVVNNHGAFRLWDNVFASDEQAYAEFQRTVSEEGMATFLDDEQASNVIPFPRRN